MPNVNQARGRHPGYQGLENVKPITQARPTYSGVTPLSISRGFKMNRPEFVYELSLRGHGIKKRGRKWRRIFSQCGAPSLEFNDEMRSAAKTFLAQTYKEWIDVTLSIRKMRTHEHGTILSPDDEEITELLVFEEGEKISLK